MDFVNPVVIFGLLYFATYVVIYFGKFFRWASTVRFNINRGEVYGPSIGISMLLVACLFCAFYTKPLDKEYFHKLNVIHKNLNSVKCNKCNYNKVDVHHHREKYCECVKFDHLELVCKRCGFSWINGVSYTRKHLK